MDSQISSKDELLRGQEHEYVNRSKTVRSSEREEARREAARLAALPGMGPTKAGQDLGVDRSWLSTWTKQMAEAGTDAFRGHGVRTVQEEELSALRRRVTVLEQERDI